MALAGKRFANVPEDLVNVRVGDEMYRRRGGWRYFRSEAKLQGLMLEKQRLALQVLMPNRLRGWVFRKFARS